jgi:hypothetical protein
MCKEAVVTSFQVLLWHLSEGPDENNKNLSQDSQCPTQNSNWAHLKHELEVLQFHELTFLKVLFLYIQFLLVKRSKS